jgi:predicted transposase YbfD/YdcC
VRDPRDATKAKYALPSLLAALIVAGVTGNGSLRHVELRTGQIAKRFGRWQGITRRIADNTFSVLARLHLGDLLGRLHALVKAEHRRGNLEPTHLPIRTAAIDGKNIATLRWHDLCRVLELDPQKASPKDVKRRLRKQFPSLQFCVPENGQPYALARVHTVTLISANAAVCLHQRPIPGATNEIGAMPALLEELRRIYGRTKIIEMVTTDAGNTSLNVATFVVDKMRLHYFAQIKSEHGDLHTEAVRQLSRRRTQSADATYTDTQNGYVVTYHVWRADLAEHGWLSWRHARQLVRVQRVAVHPVTGTSSTGNRYYVSSKDATQLEPNDALRISRGHWRCEEETHWTADVVLGEDRRRLTWSRHPNGVFVASALRMIALSILAVARKLSRFGHTKERPTWSMVAEHFLLVLCATTLLTEELDAVI